MQARFVIAAVSLAAAMLLAGCAPDRAEIAANAACKKKWQTVVSLVRCTFDMQPPPEPVLRTRDSMSGTTAPQRSGEDETEDSLFTE
jgi:hypothetical protein